MSAAVASVIAAAVSGVFAIFSFILARGAAARDRALAAEDVAGRYRSPLLHAAFDLQTRLYNIDRQEFLSRFYVDTAPPEHREYAVDNTLFLIGQYLCYSEVVRRGVIFLDPNDRRRQRALMEEMEHVRDTFSRTDIGDQTLCLFRGEQRAVGEIMLTEAAESPTGAPRWECLGYATFVKQLDERDFGRWFRGLRTGLDALAADLHGHDERLVALQHALLELIVLLDPMGEQVSSGLRRRL